MMHLIARMKILYLPLKTFSNVDLDGSGWILEKLVALDLHLLEFDHTELLRTSHFLHTLL